MSSEKLETGTTINKPAEETVSLNAGTQESGDGSNALPFIIQAAGTTPEAQIIISCTSSDTTVHCTVTDVSTGISSEYSGNPANVPLGLNGENEKLYEVKYNTKGDGYNPTTLKTKYYKILKLHTVTFNAKGGKFADDSTAKTETVLHGRTVTAPSTSPTQDGSAFLGWYKEEAGTTAWDFTNDAITKDTTLYAKWSSAAVFIKSTDADAWKKLKEEAAKTSGVSVIVIEGEIKATTDSGNSGEITIGRNLTIQGKTGATTDKLDANGDVLGHSNSHRIFKVTGGKTLTLKNLTLKGGRAEKSDSSSPLNASGGGILLESGTLSLSHVTVSDCKAITTAGNSGQGGGIYVKSGTLTINNSMLSANEASKSGGAIYADAGTTVKLDICTIQNCKASDGGAIYNDKGSLTIKGASTIKDNEATNNGGAFLIKGGSPNGSLHMENNCIVEQNKAKKGGGIYITDSGTAKILFCRVSQNEAQDDGGSVYVDNGTFTIGGSTLITPSTAGETNQKGKNDIYLANGQKITIDDMLTGTHPVARITPATYNKTTQVLGGTPALLDSEHTKFTVTQKDSEKWGVSEQGKLALMEAAIDADASPADAWKKFKEAVKAAGDGAVITVKGEIKATNATDNSGEIVIDNNLTVKKADGATSAVLNANKDGVNPPPTTHRIFKVASGKTLTLKNLTLKGGKPDISDEGSNGGAIFAKGGTLNMTNCEVKGNKADNGGGGGIYATKDGSTVSSVTISDSTIGGTGADKNESGSYDSGGGICIGDGCSLTMKNTKVIGNKSDLSGGGIFADTNSTLSMEHCTVSGNSAYSGGGGINANGTLTMTGCTVIDNETTGDSGGGMYIAGTVEIKGASTIVHNQAYVSGGGIYMASGSVTLINSTIGGEQYYDDTDPAKTKGNKAKIGVGIYVAGATLNIKDSTLSFNKINGSGNGGGGGILTSGTSSLTMETCTLTDNVANFNGGGGVYASGSAFTMTDCTLTGNVTNNNGGGGVYVAEGTFTMKGSSRITPSSGADENAMGKNEVFLNNSRMITVPAALTGTHPVARITPATYADGTVVVQGSSSFILPSGYAQKFVLTPASDADKNWTLDDSTNNQLKLIDYGVFTIAAPSSTGGKIKLSWKNKESNKTETITNRSYRLMLSPYITDIKLEAECSSSTYLKEWTLTGGGTPPSGYTVEYPNSTSVKGKTITAVFTLRTTLPAGLNLSSDGKTIEKYTGTEPTIDFNAIGLGFVEKIKYDAFRKKSGGNFTDNTTIQEVVLPNGLKELGSYAFFNCKALKKVTIPSGFTGDINEVFPGCTALEEYVIAAGNPRYCLSAQKHLCSKKETAPGSYDPNDLTLVSVVFKPSTNPTILKITDSRIKEIKNMVAEFHTFTEIQISGLTALSKIYRYAFFKSGGGYEVTIDRPTPPDLPEQSDSVFVGANQIKVPSASVTAYKAAWTNYAGIIE